MTVVHNAEGGIIAYNWDNKTETAVPFDSIYFMIKAKENMVPLSITVINRSEI